VPEASDNDSTLGEERILGEVLALVDERGLDALRTRALGHRLGVDPTAVYRHFRSKDELINALADQHCGQRHPAAGHQRWRRQARGEFRSVFIALRRPSSSTRPDRDRCPPRTSWEEHLGDHRAGRRAAPLGRL
jgi:AcrR family transcriptional regulator